MIDELIEKIVSGPYFLKLKSVVENNAYHNHETVYDHLLKTMNTAKEEIKGDFISNPEAKKLFGEFIREQVGNIERSNLMILTALLHDIGKMLQVEENGQTPRPAKPLRISERSDAPGKSPLLRI